MNFTSVIHAILTPLEHVRKVLIPIPAILLLCTSNRRPGFSSILASAKIYADMHEVEGNDACHNVVKQFVYNVVDKFKQVLHDDAVCFIIIPPGEMKYELIGANAMGPIIFKKDESSPDGSLSNKDYIFAWGIIR